MSDIWQEIQELIHTTGKTAPDMTKALKRIGDGSMHSGLRKLVEFSFAAKQEKIRSEAFRMGERSGWIKGSLVTLAAAGALAAGVMCWKDRQTRRMHREALEQEGREILEDLRSSVPNSSADTEDRPPETPAD